MFPPVSRLGAERRPVQVLGRKILKAKGLGEWAIQDSNL